MQKITIEGKEYEVIDNVSFFGKADIFTNKDYLILKPIQTPQFKVGMRVVLVRKYPDYTKDMVYRLTKDADELLFKIIDDNGNDETWSLASLNEFFKPYEKPKEGDRIWFIGSYDKVYSSKYDGEDIVEDDFWNLGLAFAGKNAKEQAEFARERLSKLF